jgi:hypothetical protein
VSYIILAKATVDFAFWFFESRELGGEGWQYYARDFRDVNSCGGSGFYLFTNALCLESCALHNRAGN